jgi:hypothetical protein
MTNREAAFLVFLICSLGINMYFLIIQTDDKKQLDDYFPTHCNDQHRYPEMGSGGGKGISEEEAKSRIENYRSADGDIVRGFVFSKQAIDRLFDMDENANSVHVMLGLEDDRIVCIIGVRQDTTTNLVIRSDQRYIIAETSCPVVCMDL